MRELWAMTDDGEGPFEPTVSVVILNWNGSELLRRFLPSVIENTPAEEATIYVVDNGSTDDSREVLRREFPQVEVIELDRNYGYAGGYNRALKQVDTFYTVLLNSDVEVTPGWLRPLIDYMASDVQCGACQPKVLNWYNRNQFDYAGAAGGYLDMYGYPYCRGRLFDTIEDDHGQYDTVTDVLWASGAAICIRMMDFEGANGFDERLFAHMEEVDLCWRFHSMKLAVTYVPQSVVYHQGGATLAMESPQKTYLNFRNSLLLVYKGMPSSVRWRSLFVRYWLDRVAALAFLCKGKPAHAWAVMRARHDYRRMRPSFKATRKGRFYDMEISTVCDFMKRSIVWEYFVKGIRRFSDLPPHEVEL